MVTLTHVQRSVPGTPFIKNYEFEFDFGPPWGNCYVTMTSVSGHLTAVDFPPDYQNWRYPPPRRLFDAPLQIIIADVRTSRPCLEYLLTNDAER
jgi:DNA topoisomerase-3